MRVVGYNEKYKEDNICLNKAWISTMFEIEDTDLKELNTIEDTINKGGQIFFALDDEDHVMACCEIARRDDGDWEIVNYPRLKSQACFAQA